MTISPGLNWAVPAVASSGVANPYAVGLGPGEKIVAYVHASGAQAGDNQQIVDKIQTTLDAGLDRCTANRGHVVVVLPGHTEDISGADQMSSLVAGTRIMCLGHGAARPTFTWTAAGSSFLFDQASTWLDNAILIMATADNAGVTVTAPITVSAAGCTISNCLIRFGDDANDDVAIGITTTAAATDFTLAGCDCYGATTAECTTFLRLVGADRSRIIGCNIQGATSSATVGVVQYLTTVSTHSRLESCTFVNNKALSVHAVTGMAAQVGVVVNCNFGILDTATLAGLETEGSIQSFKCHTSNLAGEEGGVKVPTSTVT